MKPISFLAAVAAFASMSAALQAQAADPADPNAPVPRVLQAQPPSQTTTQRLDPSSPDAAVPAAQYRSSFSGYRPLRDEPLGSWKETNDQVGRIGGWRVYAREARQPGAVPATNSPNSAPAKPASATPSEQGGGHEPHHGGKP
ncbi:MAG: hypothetical protein ACRECD_02615 [Burkholderiaceae bacterium]